MPNGQVTVPAGAVTAQYSPMNLMAQGLTQFFTGEEERKEKRKQEVLDHMANLIKLHGKDVVKMPEFKDLYQEWSGKPWPTIEKVTPAVKGKQKVTQPGIPAGMARAEGVKPEPAREVEEEIEISPEKRETMPAPLGGAEEPEPTLGELGIQFPQGLEGFGRLNIRQAKDLGVKFEDLLPMDASGVNSLDALVARTVGQYGGNINDPRLPEWMRTYIRNKMSPEGEAGVLFTIKGIPIKSTDDIRASLAAGAITLADLPPIARTLLNLDDEAAKKGLQPNERRQLWENAQDRAAKELGLYQFGGAWMMDRDPSTGELTKKGKKQVEDLQTLTARYFAEGVARGLGELEVSPEAPGVIPPPPPPVPTPKPKPAPKGGWKGGPPPEVGIDLPRLLKDFKGKTIPRSMWEALPPKAQHWLLRNGAKPEKGTVK